MSYYVAPIVAFGDVMVPYVFDSDKVQTIDLNHISGGSSFMDTVKIAYAQSALVIKPRINYMLIITKEAGTYPVRSIIFHCDNGIQPGWYGDAPTTVNLSTWPPKVPKVK